MVGWVTSLSVGLDSTPSLTSLTTHTSVRKEGLKKETWRDVLDALNLQNKQKLLLGHETKIDNPKQWDLEPIKKFVVGFHPIHLGFKD
jgi:hypothetical protein